MKAFHLAQVLRKNYRDRELEFQMVWASGNFNFLKRFYILN